MLHRVLPSNSLRVCFTIWLAQGKRPQQQPTSLARLAASVDPLDHASTIKVLLLHPHVRKHVLKLVYADEWAKSIRESHVLGRQVDQAIAHHWREIDVVKRALRPFLPAVNAMERSMAAPGKGGVPLDVMSSVAWI
uniref:Uncharacterized protein n=1 Tax=Chlamydomonas euryale TaxID=1486919 RepID=A0A7R9VFV5_9CHLO|mmetsp:Transcript_33874/g.100863  ORF Transcript_33874/g.100863 Transcript_33874/m.100863 type:complete len:136 (+) Transcript_33874:186-593(+)